MTPNWGAVAVISVGGISDLGCLNPSQKSIYPSYLLYKEKG